MLFLSYSPTIIYVQCSISKVDKEVREQLLAKHTHAEREDLG